MRVALDEIYQLLLGEPGARRAVDLTRHIDGMLSPGYPLGPCIVEFDEEQHFSPFRYVTFRVLARTIEVHYDVTLYKRCCQGSEYFARFLRKHWLRGVTTARMPTPDSFLDALINLGDLSGNGFVKPKPCFPFVGGRIAQRAYYDCLRDFFYRSRSGVAMRLKPIIRVFLYQIEERVGCSLEQARFEAVVEGGLVSGPLAGIGLPQSSALTGPHSRLYLSCGQTPCLSSMLRR
jgi:hypothetical protein